MNTPETQSNLMKIGLYGNTEMGKTRFIYAVCESVKDKLSGTASEFYTVKTAELQNYDSHLRTTTETKANIRVEIPSDDSNLGISNPRRPDTCVFEFVDWMGEVVAREVQSTRVGTTSSNSDLWERVRDADGFLYIFNPLHNGESVEKVEALLKSELEDLRTFVDEVYRTRENRFLPIVIVVTHDDKIRNQSHEIQEMIDDWKSLAVETLRTQMQKQLKSYFPVEFVAETHIFFPVSLVENPRNTFPILKKLWDLRDMGKKYRQHHRPTWIAIGIILLLLVVATTVFICNFHPELPIDQQIAKLSDDENKPGELHEVLQFRAGIKPEDEKEFPPDKVEKLEYCLKSRFNEMRARLDKEDVAFVEGEFKSITLSDVKSMRATDLCNAFIQKKVEAFLSETRAVLASCEQAKTPPLERLKALSVIADRAITSPWLDTFPDPDGKRADFRQELNDLQQFLKARIAENGYTVVMSASGKTGTPGEKGKKTLPYRMEIPGIPKTIHIATLDGKMFLHVVNRDQIISVHFPLKQRGEVVNIVKTMKDSTQNESVDMSIRTSGNTGLANLGMPMMGTKDYAIGPLKGGKMRKDDELQINFQKWEVPNLLLTILKEGESTHE